MAILTREGDRLVRREDFEKLWIEPWGKNALRVRATCQAQMPTEDWALTEHPATDDTEIIIEGQIASIRNGNARKAYSQAKLWGLLRHGLPAGTSPDAYV